MGGTSRDRADGIAGFLAWTARAVVPWPSLVALLVLSTLVQIIYLIGAPLVWKVIFDAGITDRDGVVLLGAVAVLAGLLVLFALANVGQESFGARLSVNAMNAARRRVFDRILEQSVRDHGRARAGELAGHVSTDLGAMETALVRGVPQLLTHGLSAALSVVVLFLIEWRLALATLACVPLIYLASRPFGTRATGANDALQRDQTQLTHLVQETVSAHLAVRLFRLQETRRLALAGVLDHLTPRAIRAHFLAGLVGRSAHVASGFMELVIIGVGGYLVLTGALTAGLLIAFVGLMFNIGGAIAQVNTAVPLLIQGAAGWRRMDGLLARMPEVLERSNATPLDGARPTIAIEGLTFSHDGATPTLAGIDLTIGAGETVAFVGPSGSGKSTLLSLMARLAAPGAGRVLVDGRDLAEVTEDSLRALVAVVPQGPILFDTSLRDNLLFAKPDAGQEEIEAATRAAAVHDDILALPRGYDSPAGRGGDTLSGGQRQRLAIAMALLRDPRILLLDEATSALDPVSEDQVNMAIARWARRGRTVVSVSHRLRTIRGHDRIFVFQSGHLVETGDHATLLAADGLYAKLWRRQEGEAADSPSFCSVKSNEIS